MASEFSSQNPQEVTHNLLYVQLQGINALLWPLQVATYTHMVKLFSSCTLPSSFPAYIMVAMAKQSIVEIGKQLHFQVRSLLLQCTDASLRGLPVPSALLSQVRAHGTPAKSSQPTSCTSSHPCQSPSQDKREGSGDSPLQRQNSLACRREEPKLYLGALERGLS